MKLIKLTRGRFAIVDNKDFKIISKYKWHYNLRNREDGFGRVARTISVNGKKKTEYMHRLIMKFPGIKVIDHINGNPLDNRRSNLRICSQRQNSYNQKLAKNNSSGHKGVSWRKDVKKWQVYITPQSQMIHLGFFDSLSEATKIRTKAEKKYFGEFARIENTEL